MKLPLQIESQSPEETGALGARLAEMLEEGDFVALEGNMAAGKTHFIQGLASGMGFVGHVTSPTFALMHIYEGGRMPLYHFDLYRIESPKELEDLGYEEFFYSLGVCAVEWGSLAQGYLPKRRIEVRLEVVDERKRRITIAEIG